MSASQFATALVFLGIAIMSAPFCVPFVWSFVTGHLTAAGRQKREVRKLLDVKVDMVCALLREGRGWTFDTHRGTHPAIGIGIWIANGASSLGIRFDGQPACPRDGNLARWQKRRIWAAYQGRGEDEKAAAAQLEQFLERVAKHRETMA